MPGPGKLEGRRSEPSTYEIIRSQPLKPAQLVQTTPGTATIVTSSPANVPVVATIADAHLFREISDQQLLVLLVGRPVALIRRTPEEAELLFLDSADQNGFPSNVIGPSTTL